jgi:hypothetical protein
MVEKGKQRFLVEIGERERGLMIVTHVEDRVTDVGLAGRYLSAGVPERYDSPLSEGAREMLGELLAVIEAGA